DRWSNEGIVPGFQTAGISRSLEVHDLAQQTGVQVGRESVRSVLKKRTEATIGPLVASIPPPPTSPMARSTLPPSSTGRAEARSCCSLKTNRSSGALPCPAPAGGAPPSALVCSLVP